MEKMEFGQFSDIVLQSIRDYLPETFKEAEVELNTVTKTNDLRLTGLTIRSIESNVSPTIYLESFFNRYKNGEEDLDRILSDIADIRMKHEISDRFNVDEILDWERVCHNIVPKIVNRWWNEKLLMERPFTLVCDDLVCIYQVLLSQEQEFEGRNASVAVNNKLMKSWRTDVETLHELALANMVNLAPPVFQPMSAILKSMGCGTDLLEDFDTTNEKMYVLTNKQQINGAAAILDGKFMNDIVSQLGSFTVIPSSTHELILVKEDDNVISSAELKNTICFINESEVMLEDRLSDHAYYYSVENGLVPV